MSSTDPLVFLGGRVFTALRDSAELDPFIGNRVFDGDSVRAGTAYPFVTVKFPTIAEDDDGCGRHWISTVEVHTWDRSKNSLQTRQMTGHIRDALDAIQFDFPITCDITTLTCDDATVTCDRLTDDVDFNVNYQQFQQTRVMDDPDGLTSHGIVAYEFSLSEPS